MSFFSLSKTVRRPIFGLGFATLVLLNSVTAQEGDGGVSAELGSAFIIAGGELTLGFGEGPTAPETIEEFSIVIGDRFEFAGHAIIDGAAAAGDLLDEENPYFTTAFPAMTRVGEQLVLAGTAIRFGNYTLAAQALEGLADAFVDAKFPVYTQTEPTSLEDTVKNLIRHCHALGDGRGDLAQVVEESLALALGPEEQVTEIVESLMTLEDPFLLQAFHLSDPKAHNAMRRFESQMSDPDIRSELMMIGADPSGFIRDRAFIGLVADAYVLGDSLLNSSQGFPTCTVSGTTDCPSECPEGTECPEPEADLVKFGSISSDPGDIASAIYYGSLTAVIGGAVGRGPAPVSILNSILSLFGDTSSIEVSAAFANAVRGLANRYPELYVTIKYGCCIDDTCWDWYTCWGVPAFRIIDIKECELHETDWKKTGGGDPHLGWLGSQNTAPEELAQQMEDAVDAFLEGFKESGPCN